LALKLAIDGQTKIFITIAMFEMAFLNYREFIEIETENN
jgi:hypothetical protein